MTNKGINHERILSGKEIQQFYYNNYHNYYIDKKLASDINKTQKLRQTKIMVQNIVAHIQDHIKITATYDEEGNLNLDTVNNIVLTSNEYLPKYILLLLNSKLIAYYTYNFIYSHAIRTMHFDEKYSGKIPIKKIPISKQQMYADMADKIIKLNIELEKHGDKSLSEASKIKNEIDRAFSLFNKQIYELYNLDSNDIDTIEKTYN